MATTFVDYTGDGNATKSFSFPSIQVSDVKVEVDNVVKTSGVHYNITNYTTTGGGNVVFTSGNIPSSPADIRIFRDTDVDSPKATYTAGSSVKAADLNNNNEQLLFSAQEEQNQTIQTREIKDSAVTTAKIKADAVTGAKIADDQINSEHYVDGSIDTAHIADAQITTAKIADSNVTTAKIADSNVTTAKIADNAVTMAKLNSGTLPTDITVASANIVDGTIATADIGNSQITTAKIAADAVTNAKIADDSIDSEHYVDGSIDTAHIGNSQITSAKIADANVTAAKIATNAVTTDKIADGELTTLAGMQSGTASKLADSTALTADLADLNQLDGMAKQTTITDDDTKFPTSGAIVDYVANQLSIFGGFTAIANETQFPNTQKASGAAISISDAGGVVVNGSGTSTSGTTVNGTTVTINNIPSSFHSSTITAGVRLIVTSTGSGQIYNYHKATIREEDLANLSGDINDFSERYRVGSTNPTTSLDAGDLFFNTGSGKLLVYNGTSSAWEETQSVGNFFINTLSSSSATGGGSATPNGTAYRFTLSNAGANAQQHLVSVDGVIQKPNSGSSQPSEGFAISSNDIIFGSAPVSGASIFVITIGASVSIGTPSNNTVTTAILQNGSVTTAKITDANVTTAKIADSAVTSAKIADGTIVNADVNTSAAIAGTKISPDFGSQNVVTTGTLGSGDVTITNSNPTINLVDNDANSDFKIDVDSGTFNITDTTNSADRLRIYSSGTASVLGNLDVGAGLDVTGNITVSGTVDGVDIAALNTTVGNITTDVVSDTSPQLGGNLDTNSRDILFSDNASAKFGASTDLEIFHDPTSNDSFIKEAGSGALKICSNLFRANNAANTEAMIKAEEDGAVELYHDASKKFETTSGGATITGTCTATAFSGDGSSLSGIASFPSGTKMLFAQSSAPTGWTHDTSYNDRALRLVSDSSGGGTGGSTNWTAALNSSFSTSGGSVSNHTLSTSQIPSHNHSANTRRDPSWNTSFRTSDNTTGTLNTNNTGGGGSHNHGFSNPSFNLNLRYLNVIVATKD